MTQLPLYLTPRQAADWLTEAGLPVTEDTIRRWARQRRVDHLRLPGGQYRFSKDSLAEILAGQPAATAA